MSTRPDPDEEPIRSGREFEERMFPPLVAPDSTPSMDEDPEQLGRQAALAALERLRATAGRSSSARRAGRKSNRS